MTDSIKVIEVKEVPFKRYSQKTVDEIKKKERIMGILMLAVGIALGGFIMKLFHGA